MRCEYSPMPSEPSTNKTPAHPDLSLPSGPNHICTQPFLRPNLNLPSWDTACRLTSPGGQMLAPLSNICRASLDPIKDCIMSAAYAVYSKLSAPAIAAIARIRPRIDSRSGGAGRRSFNLPERRLIISCVSIAKLTLLAQ